MERYIPAKKAQIKEFIKLLNQLGHTIVDINGEFYSSNEFESQDPNSDVFEHTIYGRDVTTLIENSIDNLNVDEHRQREIQTLIAKEKECRRRFHKDITYVIYAAQI